MASRVSSSAPRRGGLHVVAGCFCVVGKFLGGLVFVDEACEVCLELVDGCGAWLNYEYSLCEIVDCDGRATVVDAEDAEDLTDGVGGEPLSGWCFFNDVAH